MAIPEPTSGLLGLWREQSLWSRTADRMKRRIETARRTALVLLVIVAVQGTAAGAIADTLPALARTLAAAAAIGAALLPVLRPAWSGAQLRDWTPARSVAEALKSEVYLWLAWVGRYRDDPAGARLQEATSRVGIDGADLLRYRHGIEPDDLPVPAVHDVSSYFAVRVRSQIEGYYRPRAVALAMALRRFELIEFLRTAERLTRLATAARSAVPEIAAELAVKAEEVISVENQGRMAKLAEDLPAQQAPADASNVEIPGA